jgi:hypothetical protein
MDTDEAVAQSAHARFSAAGQFAAHATPLRASCARWTRLLQRRPHARHRRFWTLWLTPAGENVIVEVHRINDKVRGEALAGVSNDECKRLLDTLMQLRTESIASSGGGSTRGGLMSPHLPNKSPDQCTRMAASSTARSASTC